MKIKYKILFTFLFCVLFFANVKESRTEEIINLETEKSVIDIENESISAADGVLLKYGDISIKSDNLKKLAKRNVLFAYGNVLFNQGTQIIKANEVIFDMDTKKAKILGSESYDSDLKLRYGGEETLMTNKAGCAVYIRLHADGSTNRSLTGVSVLTSSSKNPYTKSVQKSSDKFSRDVLSEFVKATGAKNRGVSYRDDLTGTNWSTVTNTLIEMGFMSNPEEDRKMSTNDYQNKMVTGIVNGIEKYFRER